MPRKNQETFQNYQSNNWQSKRRKQSRSKNQENKIKTNKRLRQKRRNSITNFSKSQTRNCSNLSKSLSSKTTNRKNIQKQNRRIHKKKCVLFSKKNISFKTSESSSDALPLTVSSPSFLTSPFPHCSWYRYWTLSYQRLHNILLSSILILKIHFKRFTRNSIPYHSLARSILLKKSWRKVSGTLQKLRINSIRFISKKVLSPKIRQIL